MHTKQVQKQPVFFFFKILGFLKETMREFKFQTILKKLIFLKGQQIGLK